MGIGSRELRVIGQPTFEKPDVFSVIEVEAAHAKTPVD